ncbi:MAG: preprotein translocase subunit SecG [Candidatus Omnitrophica bacterium]|nr:preprotein translocase subunit SecG [Candidatus Omnitrophota bacterium]
MTGFIMFLHAIVCILLTTVILMQAGRGGGLTEAFAGGESMFGAQTNEFMTRATSVLTVLFMVTCLGLAIMSARSNKSIMPEQVAPPVIPQAPALPNPNDPTKDLMQNIPAKNPPLPAAKP